MLAFPSGLMAGSRMCRRHMVLLNGHRNTEDNTMNKKMAGGINVGTSSILVTFVLLCLVTFASLSYLSANSDYRLSLQTARRTTEYYEANRLAELYMANIEGQLSKCEARVKNASEYRQEIPKLFADNDSITVNTKTDPVTLSYDVPVNDTQTLHVCLPRHIRTRMTMPSSTSYPGTRRTRTSGKARRKVFRPSKKTASAL